MVTRGPSGLGWSTRTVWPLTITTSDLVQASKHVASSSKGVVIGSPVSAVCTGVVGISATPMGPAVVDEDTVARAWGLVIGIG
jgi:hypothetical protein